MCMHYDIYISCIHKNYSHDVLLKHSLNYNHIHILVCILVCMHYDIYLFYIHKNYSHDVLLNHSLNYNRIHILVCILVYMHYDIYLFHSHKNCNSEFLLKHNLNYNHIHNLEYFLKNTLVYSDNVLYIYYKIFFHPNNFFLCNYIYYMVDSNHAFCFSCSSLLCSKT